MNILRMRYFVDVAQMENITKAAQKNYISQTAMSQQIANIENELGVKLFTREKGRLHLTGAGLAFYTDILKVLEAYDLAVVHVKDAWRSQSQEGNIYFGILTSSTVGYMTDIIEKFNAIYSDIHVIFQEDSFSELRNKMEWGTLDAVICPAYNLEGISKINTKILAEEPIGLMVSVNHPLAKKKRVTVDDIKDERIIMTSPEYAGLSYQMMLEHRAAEGYTPNIVEHVSSPNIMNLRVGMGMGCSFLPLRTAEFDSNKCTMLEIIDIDDMSEVCLGWKKSSDDHALNLLAKLICDFFRDDYEDWIANYMKERDG